MNCAIMGNLDGHLTRVAFDPAEIKQIMHLDGSDLVLTHDNHDLFLKIGGEVYRVENIRNGAEIGPYFIVLNSSQAFSVRDYQILFNIEELSDGLLCGRDVGGKLHLCRRLSPLNRRDTHEPASEDNLDELTEKLESGHITEEDLDQLKILIEKIKKGEFLEALTMEISGKIKDIAHELIEFRKDLQSKIEPNIIDLAQKEIPEASNQLEGINETLEKSTMKIMDINEEQMEISNEFVSKLREALEQHKSKEVEPTPAQETASPAQLLNEIREEVKQLPEEMKELEEILSPALEEAEKFLEAGDLKGMRDSLNLVFQNIKILAEESDEQGSMVQVMELANRLEDSLSGSGGNGSSEIELALLGDVLRGFERISSLSLKMLEPLSFQDLVGQRIQRIVKLVKTMEERIEDLVISFGVKLQKYKEDPKLSYEEVSEEVEEIRSELKGPAREGEGLDQSAIDDLLASL